MTAERQGATRAPSRVAAAPVEPARPIVPWQVQYALLALIWGSSFLLIKYGLRWLAPVQISGLRVVTGMTTLLVLTALTRTRLPRERQTWLHLQVSGFFLATLPYTLFAMAETRVSSAVAGIGNALTPVATLVFSLLWLRGRERLTARIVVGVVLGLVGVVLLLEPWAVGRPDGLGVALALIAAASYGAGWVWNRRFLGDKDLGGLAQPTAQLIVASGQLPVVVTGWWLLQRDDLPSPLHPGAATHTGPAWVAVLAVLTLGVVGTGLSFAMQFDVVRAVGPTAATTVTYVMPLVSVILGILVLGEHLRAWQVVGGAVIILAAALVQWRPARVRLGRRVPAREDGRRE